MKGFVLSLAVLVALPSLAFAATITSLPADPSSLTTAPFLLSMEASDGSWYVGTTPQIEIPLLGAGETYRLTFVGGTTDATGIKFALSQYSSPAAFGDGGLFGDLKNWTDLQVVSHSVFEPNGLPGTGTSYDRWVFELPDLASGGSALSLRRTDGGDFYFPISPVDLGTGFMKSFDSPSGDYQAINLDPSMGTGTIPFTVETVHAVPEPSSFVIMGGLLAMAALFGVWRKVVA